jgi:hypothetical protein
VKSPIEAFYLDSFKEAAAEGAVLELKLRLLAGKVPALLCSSKIPRSLIGWSWSI